MDNLHSEYIDHEEAGPVEGRYANYFKVGHNAFDFLLDFGQLYFEGTKAQLHIRIITSPIYAKTLLELLHRSIDRYEQTFGTIPEEDSEKPKYGG